MTLVKKMFLSIILFFLHVYAPTPYSVIKVNLSRFDMHITPCILNSKSTCIILFFNLKLLTKKLALAKFSLAYKNIFLKKQPLKVKINL